MSTKKTAAATTPEPEREALDPRMYAGRIQEAFDQAHARALEWADQAMKRQDPATAELHREWAESLIDAKTMWERLEGPDAPTVTEMLERAIDATLMVEANHPRGAEKEAEGGLVMLWCRVIQMVDPGSLKRRPMTGQQLARRLSLEMVLPDNVDRSRPAPTPGLLDEAAAILLFEEHPRSMEEVARDVRLVLTNIEQDGAEIPATRLAVTRILAACLAPPHPVPTPRRQRPRRRQQEPEFEQPGVGPGPELDRRQLREMAARQQAERAEQAAFRAEEERMAAERFARGRKGAERRAMGFVIAVTPPPIVKAGEAVVGALSIVDASLDAIQGFHDRLSTNQGLFQKDGAVDWAQILAAMRALR